MALYIAHPNNKGIKIPEKRERKKKLGIFIFFGADDVKREKMASWAFRSIIRPTLSCSGCNFLSTRIRRRPSASRLSIRPPNSAQTGRPIISVRIFSCPAHVRR